MVNGPDDVYVERKGPHLDRDVYLLLPSGMSGVTAKRLSPALKKRAREIGVAEIIATGGDGERYGYTMSAKFSIGYMIFFPVLSLRGPRWVIHSYHVESHGEATRSFGRPPKGLWTDPGSLRTGVYINVGAPWDIIERFIRSATADEVKALGHGTDDDQALIRRILSRNAPTATKKALSTTTRKIAPKRTSESAPKRFAGTTPTPRSSATAPRAHIARGIRKPVHTVICQVCGKRFKAPRTDAQFCSNACRQKKYRASR
jgi:hypothetical protein